MPILNVSHFSTPTLLSPALPLTTHRLESPLLPNSSTADSLELFQMTNGGRVAIHLRTYRHRLLFNVTPPMCFIPPPDVNSSSV